MLQKWLLNKISYFKLNIWNIEFIKKNNFILLMILIITLTILFEERISLKYKLVAFTLSYILKEILMFIIPILIFPIVTKSVIEISSSNTSVLLVLILIVLVFFSNFFSIIIAYIVGLECIPYLGVVKSIKNYEISKTIYSLLKVKLPPLNIVKITIYGIISGFTLSYISYQPLLKFLEFYYQLSKFLLNKIIFFFPLYVLGTILKAINEIDFISLIPIFGKSIILVFLVQFTYIFFLFFIGSGLHFSKCTMAIKNILPAFFVGFSTMSSLITLPITLKVAEKNIKDCSIMRLTISSTVNCHDIGDCISLPLIALIIIYCMTGTFPGIQTYLWFAVLAALTQFSAASIPGGSIVVLLPILIKYLGFTEDMEILIIALSICIEPIGTAMNIAGNSAFAIIISQLFGKGTNMYNALDISSMNLEERR